MTDSLAHKYYRRFLMMVGLTLAMVFVIELPFHYWSDSEIWGVRSAAACFGDWRRYACSSKPLFSFLLAFLHMVSGSSKVIPMMNIARIVTIAFWLSALALFAQRRNWALFVAYAASTVFLFDGGVARSDFWSLPFLLLHFRFLESQIGGKENKPLIWIVPALVAVLITPKAAFSLICLTPWYAMYLRKLEPQVRRRVLVGVLGAMVLAFAFIDLRSDLAYFFRLFDRQEYGLGYWNKTRFLYLFRAVRENPQFVFLALMWIPLAFLKSDSRARTVSGTLVLLLLVFYPDKLPFWICSQILFWLYIVGPDFSQLKWLSRAAEVVAILALLNAVPVLAHLGGVSNSEQMARLRDLQGKIDQEVGLNVYDGLGLFGGSNPPNEFFGPGQHELNMENARRVREANFDLVILTHKVELFRQYLNEMLTNEYFPAGPSIFVRAPMVTIKHPRTPAPEILTHLRENFAGQLSDSTIVGIMGAARVRALSIGALGSLGPLCQDCGEINIRITPFGQILSAQAFRQKPFGDLFWFEPQARENFVPAWKFQWL